MNTLLIDVGNTRIKWAVQSQSQPQSRPLSSGSATDLRVHHCPTQSSAAQIAAHFADYLPSAVAAAQTSTSSALSPSSALTQLNIQSLRGVCVAGDDIAHRIEAALSTVLTVKPMWLTGACALPKVRNDYATPATLGADRWLAAYHVAALAGRDPAVLATFGTATTIDVLVWDEAAQCHAFKGGLILAGLNTALRSVSTSTAQLPDVAQTLMADHGLRLGTHHIPNSTQAALIQGAVAAQIGAVQHFMATVSALYGAAHCYVAGGASQALLSALSARIEGVQHLAHPVLSGLQRWSPV